MFTTGYYVAIGEACFQSNDFDVATRVATGYNWMVHHTMWAPRSITKLVSTTPMTMTMVYGTYNELVAVVYIQTYNV